MKSSNFLLQFYKENYVPPVYTSVQYRGDKEVLSLNNHSNQDVGDSSIYSTNLIPDYLRLEHDENYLCKSLNQTNKGYAILLTSYQDAESYMFHRSKSNARSVFKRYKRLCQCFDISFEIYDKSITREEYDFLMEHFLSMLVRRFEQRRDINDKIAKWDDLRKTVYYQLKENRATLSVILNQEKPIQMQLRYHVGKMLFSAIPAYDIDYSKFGLGGIAVYKEIEWCIKNNYELLDTGFGDLDYKKRWCNKVYQLEHQIAFRKNLPAIIKGNCFYWFFRIKEFIKSIRDVMSIPKWSPSQKSLNSSGEIRVKCSNMTDIMEKEDSNSGELINIYTQTYEFLKKYVFDFQYLNTEPSNNIRVYKMKGNRERYLIVGSKKEQLIQKQSV